MKIGIKGKCDECGREVFGFESRTDPLDRKSSKSYCDDCNDKATLLDRGYTLGHRRGILVGWRISAGILVILGCGWESLILAAVGMTLLIFSFPWSEDLESDNEDHLDAGMFVLAGITLIGSFFHYARVTMLVAIAGLIAPISLFVFRLIRESWLERQARKSLWK